MNTYLVKILNKAGEAEVEMVVAAENVEETVKIYQNHSIYKTMKEDGVIDDVTTQQIQGPILYVGFPLQGY